MNDDELLVMLVRDSETLYNKEKLGFKLPELKARAWRNIAGKLGRSEESCRKRWTSLRDRFKRVYERRDKTNSELKDWPLYESLLFLKSHIKPARTQNLLELESNSPTDNQYDTAAQQRGDINTLHSRVTPPISKPTLQRKRKITFCDAVDTLKDYCNTNIARKKDSEEVVLFSRVIGAKIQKLNKELQNKAMQDIMNYCIELEDCQEE